MAPLHASGPGSPVGSQLRCDGGCSQLRSCLGLENPLAEWVPHGAVRFTPGVIRASVPYPVASSWSHLTVLMTRQLDFPNVRDLREKGRWDSQ